MLRLPPTRENKSIIFSLVLILIIIYSWLAFLPIPQPNIVGLDPSWTYAISRAAADGLVFGKDIIFTYGPLGYLVGGATLKQNFLVILYFQILVNLVFWIISIIRIISLQTISQKSFLLLSLFVPYFLFGLPPDYQIGLSLDYQILLIFIIILSFEKSLKKSLSWWSVGLGGIAGFCLLTKFTLGIGTFGSLFLYLLGDVWKAIKSKSSSRISNSILSLLNSLLATISVSFILRQPQDYLFNFRKILFCLILAGIINLIFCQLKSRRFFLAIFRINLQSTRDNSVELGRDSGIIAWGCFYIIYSLSLLLLIFSSYPSWIDYINNSLQISSGYSSAMSIVTEPPTVLLLALSQLFLIGGSIFLIIKKGHLNFGLSLLLILFLTFKHGFVRQDGHIILFVSLTPFITAICLSKIQLIHWKKPLICLNLYILSLAFIIPMLQGINIKPLIKTSINRLYPVNVVHNLSWIFSPNSLQLSILKKTSINLQSVKLPENVVKLIDGKPIDIIPWEISLVEANQLNWKPRPIFQSYSAYTTVLDNLNFQSFSQAPRDYIIYNFSSIDGRHPFFDEPKTFYYVFCHYQPSTKIADFVNTSGLQNIIILEKLPLSRCLPISQGQQETSISWNSPLSIKANESKIIRANIKFKYSLWGKIYKTFFRAPPVQMNVNYLDGSQGTYRIIPENSENGVIISHLPRNNREAMSFLKGKFTVPVKSFSFSTMNPPLYAPKIEIVFP